MLVGFFGGFRFRVWMPVVAVLIVLLSIATLLSYVLPAARARLVEFSEDRAVIRAAAAASALGDLEEVSDQQGLDLAAQTARGEVLVVDRRGRVVARAGPRLLSPPPEEVLRRAAEGRRLNYTFGEQQVAVVPLVRGGALQGGVVFAPDSGEGMVNEIFVRSGVEAALVASILGGGLALLLATLLSRRVERLTSGARAIEGGDLSYRIEPGSNDELGELARSFNSMAGRLQTSFERLKEGGATLNAILNNLAEGVLATDLEGKVMFINLAARDMLSLGSEGPLDEAPDPWKDFDLPAAVGRCAKGEERVEARVSDGEGFFQVKLEHMSKFDDHRGGVLVVVRDLSEGRRLEANQQRFLANAAHELKTPITTVVGASELLLTEREDDPETRRRFLEHIHAEARRMQRLSETLLRLARTGADLRNPEVEVLDLEAQARDAVERIRPLSEAEGLDLAVEGRGGRVRADREWLEQCLLIVLRNAVQHSGREGGVRVRLEGAAVSVEDEGVGIAEEDLPRVFERFHRGGGSGGFGLGLPICKNLVERMGGSITLDSEEGVGTTVRIELSEVA